MSGTAMARWAVPASWSWATLADVADVVGGGTPDSKRPDYWGGEIPWVTPADLSGYTQKTITHGARSITADGLANSGARMLPTGTVLMSSRAPIGYVAIAAGALSTNQGFKSFVLHPDLLPDYVYWFLRGNTELLGDFASGTTFPEVSGRRAAEIPIPIAPLAEQRRIVAALEEHLSDLDAAVAGLGRARANVRRYAQAVISEAVTPRWEWPVIPLRELGALKGGITKGQKRRQGETTRPVPYLRVANVQRGWLDLADVREIEATEAEIADLRLQAGDILFNEGGDRDKLGRGWVWDGELPECIHQNHVFRARLDSARVAPRFVSHFANTIGQRYFVEQGRQTTNLASINLTKLGALPVPVPPIEAQHAILDDVERRLAVAERTAADIDVQLARAARLRQAVLQRAFSGRLVPQDPADEPAAALLARVRAEHTPAPRQRARRPAAAR